MLFYLPRANLDYDMLPVFRNLCIFHKYKTAKLLKFPRVSTPSFVPSPQISPPLYIHMTSTLNSRLSSLLPPSIISRKGALALSSCATGPGVDGLRWWIDCQPNPTVSFFKLLSVVTLSSLMFCKQLQFELRLLLFLLEDHIFSGDLWRLVMAHHIEIMQEAQLHKPETQPQNYRSGERFARELELLEDKRDRARLELSLYSQAMDVFQPQLACMYTLSCLWRKILTI